MILVYSKKEKCLSRLTLLIAGKIKITGSYLKLSKTKPKTRSAAPLLGQHAEEVLDNLSGLEKIRKLKEKGVI